MIFKICKHVDRDGVSDKHGHIDVPVVPRENWLFEAPSGRYTKVKITTWHELNARMEGWPVLTVIGPGPPCTCTVHEKCSKCEKEFDKWLEYIELILMYGDNSEMVVATEASLYIMNDQGKTVDTVHCYGN